MNRAEQNLIFWRSLVGLEASFPSLPPLREDELRPLVVIDESQLDTIRSGVASEQLTQIVVQPGWGCTTLFRYLVNEARDRVMERLSLPVALDMEHLFLNDEITPDSLEAEIKRQIIGLLVDNPWESSLNRDYYFECIDYDSSTDLATYKARMLRLLFERPLTSRRLLSQFPWLRDDLHVQLHYLLTNLRIQTVLYIHFPRIMDSQRIRDLVSAIKRITSDTGSIDYAAWREVYLCTPRQRPEIGRDFQRPFHIIRYPSYTSAQVYLMLVKRYQPALRGLASRRLLSLSEVFSETFVEQAWRGAASLDNLASQVLAAMLRRLDCPETEVRFHLEPSSAAGSEGGSRDEGVAILTSRRGSRRPRKGTEA